MSKRVLVIPFLALGVCVSGIGFASAHDHEVPKVVAKRGSANVQRGKILASCWAYPQEADGSYIVGCHDYAWRFPQVDRVRVGQRIALRIRKQQVPEETSVHAWTEINAETNRPQGDATVIDHVLEPVLAKDGSTRAWDVVVALPDRGRHYYLRLSTRWPDEEVPEEPQTAQWSFHLKARR